MRNDILELTQWHRNELLQLRLQRLLGREARLTLSASLVLREALEFRCMGVHVNPEYIEQLSHQAPQEV